MVKCSTEILKLIKEKYPTINSWDLSQEIINLNLDHDLKIPPTINRGISTNQVNLMGLLTYDMLGDPR